MAELPHIGKNCFFASCKQLDFLPFDCDGCGKTFCLQHKAKDDHHCTKHLLAVSTRVYDGPKAFPCSMDACSSKELQEIVCEHCHHNFCLSHRHQQDHKCTKLSEKPVPNAKTAEHVANVLANKAPAPARKPLKSLKSRQTAARIALMKLKGKAEGDKGLPETERVFFSVALPLSSKLGPKAVFVSQTWIIGRVIDYLADKAGIHNPNNTGTEKKLRLFAGDSGLMLPVEKKMEDVLTDEFALYNGSSLILELVDQTVAELPNAAQYPVAS